MEVSSVLATSTLLDWSIGELPLEEKRGFYTPSFLTTIWQEKSSEITKNPKYIL